MVCGCLTYGGVERLFLAAGETGSKKDGGAAVEQKSLGCEDCLKVLPAVVCRGRDSYGGPVNVAFALSFRLVMDHVPLEEYSQLELRWRLKTLVLCPAAKESRVFASMPETAGLKGGRAQRDCQNSAASSSGRGCKQKRNNGEFKPKN